MQRILIFFFEISETMKQRKTKRTRKHNNRSRRQNKRTRKQNKITKERVLKRITELRV